ncbi:hypothetical protein CCUS01_14432 [Colletotrichum cuscutae]|uniref:Uncharacterized protein n=1 Tax=Colletotrichum cuscutae TaxID=1209917 RepID=A0AAI9Y910_9PEZI|nr:hypothetical protein CCUS01_14432 [Colletotrichum cuscutae]
MLPPPSKCGYGHRAVCLRSNLARTSPPFSTRPHARRLLGMWRVTHAIARHATPRHGCSLQAQRGAALWLSPSHSPKNDSSRFLLLLLSIAAWS